MLVTEQWGGQVGWRITSAGSRDIDLTILLAAVVVINFCAVYHRYLYTDLSNSDLRQLEWFGLVSS